ncbi:topless-related protein [Trifolium repens]|nr:topless-related protein [Trifolium repens]
MENEPSHCRSLKLPENVKVNKISRLIYTNSGNAILALASNAIHLLWKWPRNDRNSSSMANASVQPQLWQPSSGIMTTDDIAHSNPEDSVPCFALSKNDSYVMSASGGKISLFNMMTFKTMTTFVPPPPAATFLAFHPQDNNIIAIGMDDSSIQIYNVRVDEVKSKLKGHTKRITGLAFSHVLNVLVSSGADAQICVWNTDGWEKQKTRFLQLPPGRTPSAQSDTRVQFHQDQIQFLVVHETQLSIFEATKLECLKQISRLIYTNYGDSILALASNTIHLPWIWPRNDHNSSSKNGDARNTGDVKPRICEGSNDKSKIWKLTEINEPSHCRSLKLPENVKVNKISRLIYTNSGDSILALASNTIHLLWIWQRNDHNSSSKTKTAFMPPPPTATFLVFNASNLRLRCRINPSAYSVRQFSTRRRGQGNHRHKQQKSSCFEDYYPVAW